jgi:Fe-S oxidoreductase/FAD/FMN-containing dehydrogenase
VSTSSRATIGGMAGNNSCGGRSLRYGSMRDNVVAIDAILPDGSKARFGPGEAPADLAADLLALGAREADEVRARFPDIQRRVGGYNLDALTPDRDPVNFAHLLVGSEGTLAFSTRIELALSPLVGAKHLAVCAFPSFRAAMEAPQHIAPLTPLSVELVDATMIGLAREIAMFRPTLEAVVTGEPAALLLVEFDEGDAAANRAKIADLRDVMAGLGHADAVTAVEDAALQAAVTELRKSGLNIMMSMKSAGKPVSFVEDCAVPLADLADYTERLTAVFEKHGTTGTWYAHAGSGCLHVRPVLNLKLDRDLKAMRAIAEEAFAMVREYKGSHSGEHGDGIARSEFHEAMFGPRVAKAFIEVKHRFDPGGLMNPGKIVDAPKMDDRRLLRYGPDYRAAEAQTAFDWSAYPGALQGAVEMCNNNGACRKLRGGAMCPSYRVTRNERDVVRGRANVLRLALSGQLGAEAFTSDAMAESLSLCVGCKACKRECPTGVDMAKFKIEVQAARGAFHGFDLGDRLVGHLPRYAPWAARAPWLANLRNRVPALARAMERLAGFAAGRALPAFRGDAFRDAEAGTADAPDAVLFADTFNRYFEPENLRAAVRVLGAAQVRLAPLSAPSGRPLCCGRTYLSVGMVDRARAEATRLLEALRPHLDAGRPVIGLEPSCLLTLRDEIPALLPGELSRRAAEAAMMLEEFLIRPGVGERLPLRPASGPIHLHGHCHQKAHGVMGAVEQALRLIPDADVRPIESSCCGMAGSFGYKAETEAVSRAMGELSLAPAARDAGSGALVVADGTSCRHQIADLAGREAVHVARALDRALDRDRAEAPGQPPAADPAKAPAP